ncbi:30S ribosomal protein S20 [Candidatus Peregrinibacteria bacterium]|nr:30S ribosomal protein S20 [Candidatus Peregrinibacteria bacterium]
MPVIKASIKDLRKSAKHRAANRIEKDRFKTAFKDIIKLAQEKNFAEFKVKLPVVTSLIDKAAKNHLLHKNNASNKKARLARLLAAHAA